MTRYLWYNYSYTKVGRAKHDAETVRMVWKSRILVAHDLYRMANHPLHLNDLILLFVFIIYRNNPGIILSLGAFVPFE
jgi:hypothetical protein